MPIATETTNASTMERRRDDGRPAGQVADELRQPDADEDAHRRRR